MKIAIIGTRGIPNHYGGFEQCAEYLALGLVKNGHQVLVYNSHNHPYQEKQWRGVEIIHSYDPEDKIGTAGQFIYDLNCILDVRKRNVDIVLQLGYTSSSVWGWLMPKRAIITTNMDGLEWKRTKYSNKVRSFLLWAEKLGVKFSDYLIADSVGIQDYLKQKYAVDSEFIPYGADVFTNPQDDVLQEYSLKAYNYDLLIARLEPENSIEVILDGVAESKQTRPFLVIGKHETPYGEYLKQKFKSYRDIRFIGGIYNIEKLNNIRYFSNIYFHGHTVGGTNPSLLEAMASRSLVCANSNPFNRYILGDETLYFSDAKDVRNILDSVQKEEPCYVEMLNQNLEKVAELYNWDKIVQQYTDHFNKIVTTGKRLGSK